MSAQKDLKAFVRLDANSRVVPGSLIFRKRKPLEGRFMEIKVDQCCGQYTLTLFIEDDAVADVTLTNSVGVDVLVAATKTAIITVPELLKVAVEAAGTVTYNIFDNNDANIGTGSIIDTGTIDLTGLAAVRIIFS